MFSAEVALRPDLDYLDYRRWAPYFFHLWLCFSPRYFWFVCLVFLTFFFFFSFFPFSPRLWRPPDPEQLRGVRDGSGLRPRNRCQWSVPISGVGCRWDIRPRHHLRRVLSAWQNFLDVRTKHGRLPLWGQGGRGTWGWSPEGISRRRATFGGEKVYIRMTSTASEPQGCRAERSCRCPSRTGAGLPAM